MLSFQTCFPQTGHAVEIEALPHLQAFPPDPHSGHNPLLSAPSPLLWTLLSWLFRPALELNVFSQSGQSWLWSEWCNCLCLDNFPLEANVFWHLSQFSFSESRWVAAWCSASCGLLRKALSQSLHLWGLSSKCFIKWFLRWVVVDARYSHWSHFSLYFDP